MADESASEEHCDRRGGAQRAATLRFEDLYSALVLPISKFGPGKDGEPEPLAAVGTGFTFGEHTMVTCWHCVEDPLGDGEFYAVV